MATVTHYTYVLTYRAFYDTPHAAVVFDDFDRFTVPRRLNETDIDKIVDDLTNQVAGKKGWNRNNVRLVVTNISTL